MRTTVHCFLTCCTSMCTNRANERPRDSGAGFVNSPDAGSSVNDSSRPTSIEVSRAVCSRHTAKRDVASVHDHCHLPHHIAHSLCFPKPPNLSTYFVRHTPLRGCTARCRPIHATAHICQHCIVPAPAESFDQMHPCSKNLKLSLPALPRNPLQNLLSGQPKQSPSKARVSTSGKGRNRYSSHL